MAGSRTQFRSLLQRKQILLAPGAFDGLSAKLIERAGFRSFMQPGVASQGAWASQTWACYPLLKFFKG